MISTSCNYILDNTPSFLTPHTRLKLAPSIVAAATISTALTFSVPPNDASAQQAPYLSVDDGNQDRGNINGDAANGAGLGAIAIGTDVSVNNPESIVIGNEATSDLSVGSSEIIGDLVIGAQASSRLSYIFPAFAGQYNSSNVVLGYKASTDSPSGGAVVIGDEASNATYSGIAIGNNSKVTGLDNGATFDGNGVQGGGIAIGAYALSDYSGTTRRDDFPLYTPIAIGAVSRATSDGAISIGEGSSASGETAISIGVATNAAVDDGVALGSYSTASRDVPVIGGYDLAIGGASSITTPTWKGTTAAVSVGDEEKGITRQITSVAAGSNDTDAVNVAQLKQAALTPLRFSADSGADVNRVLGETLNIRGGATGNLTDDNISVVSNGTNGLEVKLASDIDLGSNGSISLGDTSIDTNGITINGGSDPVSLTANGLDNGGNVISNVANGVANTDAVNLGQLTSSVQTAAAAAKTEVVGGTNIASIGETTDTKDGHTVYEINANGTSVSAGSSAITVSANDAGNNVTDYSLDVSSDIKQGAATALNEGIIFDTDNGSTDPIKLGSTIEIVGDNNNNIQVNVTPDGKIQIQITDQPHFGDVSVNADGSGRISGVSDGAVAQGSTDAVNGDQLYTATKEAGQWTLSVDGDAGVTVGEGNREVGVNGSENIWVRRGPANNNDLTFGTNPDLKADSVTIANGGPVINRDGINMQGNKVRNVAPGTQSNDAATVGQLPLRYVTGTGNASTSPTNTAGLVGAGGAPVRVTNVAPGQIAPGSLDTINGSQLYDSFKVINDRVADNRAEANSGIASAMALGQIRYDDRPGKFSMGLGLGYYGSESGVALGVGYTSENQLWRFSGGATYAPGTENLGAAVSATYTFN